MSRVHGALLTALLVIGVSGAFLLRDVDRVSAADDKMCWGVVTTDTTSTRGRLISFFFTQLHAWNHFLR